MRELEAERARVAKAEREAAADVAATRRRAAPRLGEAVAAHLRELAIPAARIDVVGAGEVAARRTAFQALYAEASSEAQAIRRYVGDNGTATLLSSESYPQAHAFVKGETP